MDSTVLVIGAGASAELKFPVGMGLAAKISNTATIHYGDRWRNEYPQSDEFFSIVQTALARFSKYKGEATVAMEKMRKLSLGVKSASSIDNYLHIHRADDALVLVGKLAIAYEIVRLEQNSVLATFSEEGARKTRTLPMDTWHIAFFRTVIEQCTFEELPERLKTITVISFNYDRVFEEFLVFAIAEQYDRSEDEAAAAMKNLLIYHPYGSLGLLRSIDPNGGRQYGEQTFTEPVIQMASAIRTFTEGIEANDPLQHAVGDRLRSATRTIFLGFGFLSANMKLLESLVGEPWGMKQAGRLVFGTCFEVSDFDQQRLKFSVAQLFNLELDEVFLKDMTCKALFHWFSTGLRFV